MFHDPEGTLALSNSNIEIYMDFSAVLQNHLIHETDEDIPRGLAAG